MVNTLMQAGWNPDVLAPAPMHRHRLRERGYNQSLLLAAVIAESTGSPVADVLIRTRSTATQVGLSQSERQSNVAGAFAARGRLDGLSVMLIDDVVTTGATLTNCATACRSAGAASVRALVLATEI